MALLRCNRGAVDDYAPCQLTIHFPPPDGTDKVVLEITRAKLKQPKE